MKNGSIRRATAFMNAQSAPSGDAGETMATDLPGSAATAGPFPLSRTWNESVNESERDFPLSTAVAAGDGVGAAGGGRDWTVASVSGAATVAAGTAVEVSTAVCVGVGVPASSRSLEYSRPVETE